jgi:hypothetical protein
MAETEILPRRDTLVAPDTALRLRIEIDETAAELSDILSRCSPSLAGRLRSRVRELFLVVSDLETKSRDDWLRLCSAAKASRLALRPLSAPAALNSDSNSASALCTIDVQPAPLQAGTAWPPPVATPLPLPGGLTGSPADIFDKPADTFGGPADNVDCSAYVPCCPADTADCSAYVSCNLADFPASASCTVEVHPASPQVGTAWPPAATPLPSPLGSTGSPADTSSDIADTADSSAYVSYCVAGTADSSTYVSRSPADIPARSSAVSDCPDDMPHSSADTSNRPVDSSHCFFDSSDCAACPFGSPIDVSGSPADVSGISADVSADSYAMSDGPADTPDWSGDLSGCPFNAPGRPVYTSGGPHKRAPAPSHATGVAIYPVQMLSGGVRADPGPSLSLNEVPDNLDSSPPLLLMSYDCPDPEPDPTRGEGGGFQKFTSTAFDPGGLTPYVMVAHVTLRSELVTPAHTGDPRTRLHSTAKFLRSSAWVTGPLQ